MTTEIIACQEEQPQTVGLRIKHLRKSLRMTQKRFAESLGIVQGFLSAIEQGKKMPSDTLLIALQHLYKVKPEWIHAAEKVSLTSDHYHPPEAESLALVPLLNKLPADKTEFRAPDNFKRYISLPGLPKDCFAFEYRGDYMLPTIRDGDIIIIQAGKTLARGNICLIVGKWGEPLLRRYRERNGQQYFSPDNSSYSSFQPDDSNEILGFVVKIWREIKI